MEHFEPYIQMYMDTYLDWDSQVKLLQNILESDTGLYSYKHHEYETSLNMLFLFN